MDPTEGSPAGSSDRHEVSRLLAAWSTHDPRARDALIPIVHEELRRLAHRYMRGERAGHTLQTTALVNEVYMRLVDLERISGAVAGTSSPWRRR